MIGGSAGSLPPLLDLVAGLPAELPAAVLIVVHRGDHASGQLASILSRSGPLPAGMAEDGDPIRRGRIYVAPPRRHLLTGYGWIQLRNGPRVNRYRPAIDVLFASTVRWAAGRTVSVVLSGVLDDGAVGAALVARAGGRVLVQDPAEAAFAGMPAAALAAAAGAIAAPAKDLAQGVLDQLARVTGATGTAPMHIHDAEADMGMADSDPGYLAEGESRLTRMVCPECGGSLAQVDLPQISYFRCHVGHQYSPQTLSAAQAETAEAKLWGAVAALEEQAAMLRYLRDTTGGGNGNAEEVAGRAATLREHAQRWAAPLPGEPEEPPE
ncbi:chemotaxis protein CheB [Jatrophihabitans sp.]|uniref:chemotaxis protein CheB n=1 Tax=Jatrophihabitans sp. TaxID=1932789 RepID=UPI002CEA1589|nr:chemotaxis protein CheB [Jatrophihabitans sp.]